MATATPAPYSDLLDLAKPAQNYAEDALFRASRVLSFALDGAMDDWAAQPTDYANLHRVKELADSLASVESARCLGGVCSTLVDWNGEGMPPTRRGL